MRSHRSRFFTGFFAEVIQPLAIHPSSHLSRMAFDTYCESVYRSTVQGSFSSSSARSTAMISMRLLVVGRKASGYFTAVIAGTQYRRPAAGAGIAEAGTVSMNFNVFHQKFLCGLETSPF